LDYRWWISIESVSRRWGRRARRHIGGRFDAAANSSAQGARPRTDELQRDLSARKLIAVVG